MSKLKVIGPREEFGSVFPAYADLARACVPLGCLDHDEAFVEIAMKMVKKCSLTHIPQNLMNAYGSYQAYKKDHDETQLDLAAAIRGSERDIFLYHLYGLMTHRQLNQQRQADRSGDSVTITGQRHQWMLNRAYLDADSLFLKWPDDEEANKVRRLLKGFGEKDPEADDLWLHDEAPVAFSIENPGFFETFYTKPSPTALMGVVHGRPFYFLNTPFRHSSDRDRLCFERDEITVIHGMDRVEVITPSLPDSSTGEIIEGGDQLYYVCVPSLHKASHHAIHQLPQGGRSRNPTAFLNEVMAPKIREEYGRLLPESFHKLGVERAMEGDFDIMSLDLNTKNARLLREEAARRAKDAFYVEEDVGMF